MTSVPLHYTVDGPVDAPVLVLGSSLGTTGEMWAPQVAALAQRFRLVRYDHRGHGRSPVPEGPYAMADLGGDVLALLDHLGLDRVHLGGLSMGGMAAMWVAAHAPARVDRLALLCTSAKLGPPELWVQRSAAVRAAGNLESIADGVVARWLPPDFAAAHPPVLTGLRDMLTATPASGYASCCDAIGAMDLRPDLPRITAPTLVLAGLLDEASPPANAQLIVDLIPDARLVLVSGAAHLANVSRAELVGELLVEFLTDPATVPGGAHHDGR